MRTAQVGDAIQVHYVVRSQDGSVRSSRRRGPLNLTVGIDNPRLPGLGLGLVGLSSGQRCKLTVPPERAYGLADPARIRRWPRQRFVDPASLQPGSIVRVTIDEGRSRLVRVLRVGSKVVVVDANRLWAGQTLEIEVQLVAFQGPDTFSDPHGLPSERPTDSRIVDPYRRPAATPARIGDPGLPAPGRVIAMDVDAASLASLQEALPNWQIDLIDGATADSLVRGWDPGAVDLLVVGIGGNAADTLALCRFLASCTLYSGDFRRGAALTPGADSGLVPTVRGDAPLVVLVPDSENQLVGAALRAGARGCLVLPIHPKKVRSLLARLRAGDQPGRHTGHTDRAQREDPWRDAGGEA